ncbi:hypothetical protein HF086_001436 [Spodoptera exigua]|uniref:Uncharacterized protein n=1 Tax=Spodoptera exigua TaxID=7107 RepID=A0A922SFD7_SPOEX|nr:hypothetical protein HF086_001436 [Spodoptera exigua]
MNSKWRGSLYEPPYHCQAEFPNNTKSINGDYDICDFRPQFLGAIQLGLALRVEETQPEKILDLGENIQGYVYCDNHCFSYCLPEYRKPNGIAIIELLVVWEKPGLGKYKWRLWKNVFVIIIGIFLFVAGTYSNAKGLILNL